MVAFVELKPATARKPEIMAEMIRTCVMCDCQGVINDENGERRNKNLRRSQALGSFGWR